jgi:predicted nucleic acid-binding protein
MSGVFLDTSAIFAAARPRSEHHAQARREYEALFRGPERLVTTDLVIAEVHALSGRRAGPATALDLAWRLFSSTRIDTVHPGAEQVTAAFDLLRARPGRPYSLTDAISMVVMRYEGIARAFTLDADFAAEGFAVVPIVT